VVVEIDALCLPTAAIPPEDQAPLIVDADRMKARQVSAELLEAIAWRHPQIMIGSRIVDHLKPAKEPAFEIGRYMPRLPILDEEGAQPLVPKAYDHAAAGFCTYTPLLDTDATRNAALVEGQLKYTFAAFIDQ
jgi:hypothetical protein